MVRDIPYHVGEAHQKEVKRKITVCTVDFLNKKGEADSKEVPASKKTGKPTAKTYQNIKASSITEARTIQGSSAKTREAKKKHQTVHDQFMASMGYQTTAEKKKDDQKKARRRARKAKAAAQAAPAAT